jgi:hypothetical protein
VDSPVVSNIEMSQKQSGWCPRKGMDVKAREKRRGKKKKHAIKKTYPFSD